MANEDPVSTYDICRASVADTVQAIRTKRLSPVEITDAVLNRIEELNPRVNAYCTVASENARRQAAEAEAAAIE